MFFRAVITPFQIPNDVRRCRQTRALRSARAEKPREHARRLGYPPNEISLIHRIQANLARPGTQPRIAASRPKALVFRRFLHPSAKAVPYQAEGECFRFSETVLDPTPKSPLYPPPSRPAERGVGHRHERGTGCGGRGGAGDERCCIRFP